MPPFGSTELVCGAPAEPQVIRRWQVRADPTGNVNTAPVSAS